MPEPTRKYAMTKLSAGDYLLPSNDGTRLLRITRSEKEGWDVFLWAHRLDLGGHVDPDDWSAWDCIAQWLPSRNEAIREALTVGGGS